MDYTDTEQALLKRWQCLQRRSGDASTLTPFQRADCARQLAELPRYAAALKVAPLRDLEPITRRLADRYVLPETFYSLSKQFTGIGLHVSRYTAGRLVDKTTNQLITARNSSCGRVMFSQACVKNSVHSGRGVSQHALLGHMTSTI